MTRRRLLGLLLASPAVVPVTLTSSGCRQVGADEDGRITIRYMAWGNPEQIAVERQIADEFEKRHPGIRVHLFMVPGSSYPDKLQLMLASRTAPDVMRADHYYFPALVRKEYFLPLEPLIAREKPGFLADFVPTAIEEGMWDGKLYGMNVLFGGVMIYYNKNLFEEAGLPDPYSLHTQGKWTWDTFVAAARALTERGPGGRPVQFGTNMVNFPLYASVVWNHGGDFMNRAMTRFTAAEDPDAVAGMQKYADLRWEQGCAPTPADTALSAFTFESGKIAMHWGWAGESPRFRKNIKSFAWDIVPTPPGPEGDATVIKGNQLVIYRETGRPAEAWEFVKFMTSPYAERLLCGTLRRAVPTRLSVQDDPRYLQADEPPYHTDVFLETVRRGRTLPIDWRYQEWSQVYNSAIEALFNVNEKNARQALDDAARRVNAVLSGEEGF
jgi:multiple sugar transport system substrate-binding protein